jgi:UDP-N-acetyl-D-galactosamine dehydrogenase
MLVAVAHRQFIEWGAEKLRTFGKSRNVLYDLKYVLPQEASDLRL